eukprot:superscaffoldBa00001774_g11970
MLTCEICGEGIMLEEDMKTHLLLRHLENDMHCPLCSLSGVSYDELSFHISSAHPENQHRAQVPAHSTSSLGCSTGTITGVTDCDKPQTSQSCLTGDSCGAAGEAISYGASSVTTDSVQPEQNRGFMFASDRRDLTHVETIPIISTTLSSNIKQECARNCSEDAGGSKSEHNKAKQKRLSSPGKEKLFSCPMCALVCSSCFILQEHVELHLQEQHSAEGSALEVFPSAMTSPSASSLSGSPGSDLKLARKLQQEEEQRRREDEAQKEREEFKKLQRQFGLDGSGGYRRQMERTMERDVARGLMAPTEFHCLVRALYEYYQTECRDCVHVWLSADTDHFCSSAGDKGWGCGYRNFQMLLSSLHRIDTYAPFLQEKAVPSIPRVQSMIEEAWKGGLDPQGASHFNQRLQGTRAWIGATEIYALLTSLGIR